MFFFCKPKELILDVFTTDPHVADLLAPNYASKFKPKWWYDTPSSRHIATPTGIITDGNTIKRCRGFKDYYSDASLVLPLWNSFILEYSVDGSRFSFASSANKLEYQSEDLRGGLYLKEFHQFKLNSPWRFREKTGINFLFGQAFYNFKDPTEFVMPPAIVNYKYQNATEINFFVKKPDGGSSKRLEFEAGQPMAYLTPLTEKRVVIRTHLVSAVEFEKVNVPILFFSGLYGKVKRLGYGK